MKIKCDICKKEFDYPYDIDLHRHKEYELNEVTCNFWSVIDHKLTQDCFIPQMNEEGVFRYINTFPDIKYKYTLNEGNTPLIPYRNNVYIKDESKNPTGSFKDRGMPLLMNEILLSSKNKIATVSTGNAAISVMRYAKTCNIQSILFVSEESESDKLDILNQADELHYSSNLIESFEKFARFCHANSEIYKGYLSTNISYSIGLKTLSYEIYEQLGQQAPDYILLPCASGSSVVAQYNAWLDLYRVNLIDKIPKLLFIQIEGGDPMEQGFEKGCFSKLYVIDNPVESRSILSSDTCFNYFKIIEIMKKNHAKALSITNSDLDMVLSSEKEMHYEYSSLSVFAAYHKYQDMFKKTDKVVLVATSIDKKQHIKFVGN